MPSTARNKISSRSTHVYMCCHLLLLLCQPLTSSAFSFETFLDSIQDAIHEISENSSDSNYGSKSDEPHDHDLRSKTCSKEKKVAIYKFCIEGDCDSGAEGEHRLKLDGHWLWGGYRDFREGQCHSINHSAKTVDAWKSLAVGTEEHDDWSENDSYFATLPASSWYSESCETYEVILAKEHTSEKKESVCWEISATGGIKGADLGE